MKIKLKFIAIFLINIITCSLLCSCFNYRDINKLVFITAMVIDIDDDGDIVLYTEAFKPSRTAGEGGEGGGKGQRILFKGKGKTLFEAIRDASLASSYKNNYTQNRAIIITKKAAEKGFEQFIDFLDRDQEILARAYMFVYIGDVEKLLKLKLKSEEYIGTYLYNLIQITGTASRAINITLNEFLTRNLIGSNVEVIPILNIRKESLEDTIEINGGAVIQDNKMVTALTRSQSQGYNFLINEVKKGTLEVTNPDNQDDFVTLEILNSHTKTKIELKDSKIKLKKEIIVRVSIGESQNSLRLTEENRKKIEKSAENNLRKYTSILFEDYKCREIDAFRVKEELDKKYPNNNINNVMEMTELEVGAHVEIEGSSNKLDYVK